MMLLLDTHVFLWWIVDSRMLVAQCKVENCSIITADSIIVKYDVPTVW